MSIVRLQKSTEDSILPKLTGGYYTIYSNEDIAVHPHIPTKLRSGFKIAVPSNYCALVTRYSELEVLGGLIDSDYRGDVSTIVCSPTEVKIARGEPIAKMLILEIATPELEDNTPVRSENQSDNN